MEEYAIREEKSEAQRQILEMERQRRNAEAREKMEQKQIEIKQAIIRNKELEELRKKEILDAEERAEQRLRELSEIQSAEIA